MQWRAWSMEMQRCVGVGWRFQERGLPPPARKLIGPAQRRRPVPAAARRRAGAAPETHASPGPRALAVAATWASWAQALDYL